MLSGLNTQKYISFIKDDGLTGCDFSVDDVKMHLPLSGRYNFKNALLAIGVAKELGLTAGEIKTGVCGKHTPVSAQRTLQLAVFLQQAPSPETGLFPVRGFGQVKSPGHTGIDDRDAVPASFPLEVRAGIGLVDMTVDHDRGAPGVQQRAETFKPPVGKIILVPETADR